MELKIGKRFVPVVFLLVAAAPLRAADTAPAAAIRYSPEAPGKGQTVQFTDASTGSPTSWNWDFGDGGTSTSRNPSHVYGTAGIFVVTLTIQNGSGSSTATRCLSTGTASGRPPLTMAQTLGDGGQRNTIAFDGFGMVTGNLEAQSFFPPGKVADYWGFQYFRDNDPDDMGHNTSFLTRIANNIIFILNDGQLSVLKSLARSQVGEINLYGLKRYPLMKAFRRLLDGDLPEGSSGLSIEAVKEASRDLYRLDGQVSFNRAVVYADIYRTLDASQKGYLDAMKGKGWKSWPDVKDDQVRSRLQGLPRDETVAVMTYASDMFTWYAGAVDADVYFCPERQGTYFGSFYIKDAPAIGHEGYGIDEQLTASAGQEFLNELARSHLDVYVTGLVDVQRSNLYAGSSSIVQIRTEIATLLRSLITPAAISDSAKSEIEVQVLEASETYGELDGEINHAYAVAFARVHASLDASGKANLAQLRKSIMSGTYSDGTPFDFSVCTTPFLYSEAIQDPSVLAPYISDTDRFFGSGSSTPVEFRRGDANGDGDMDLSDAVDILDFLFRGGPTVPCEKAADANDDAKVDISDPIFMLVFLFLGGEALARPFPSCGIEQYPKGLTCESYPSCLPSASSFTLASTAFQDKGTLPVAYTCDGAGHSPPLAWTGVPEGTLEFAVMTTTLALDGMKWNWVLYGIPGNVTSLSEGTVGVGTAGLTSDGPNLAYSPPCSKGPGAKTYTFTVYALSGTPTLAMPAGQVTGAVLTSAISQLTLASSQVSVTYTR